jgi:elongation factor G
MEARGNAQVVRAFVPLATMFGYTTDLRSATQGRATSSMEFAYYQPLAQSLADEIIAKRRG